MADQVKYLKGSNALPRKRCWDDGGLWDHRGNEKFRKPNSFVAADLSKWAME